MTFDNPLGRTQLGIRLIHKCRFCDVKWKFSGADELSLGTLAVHGELFLVFMTRAGMLLISCDAEDNLQNIRRPSPKCHHQSERSREWGLRGS